MTMKIEEAIEQLRLPHSKIKQEALDCLRDHWQESEALLLAEIDHPTQHPDENLFLIYALFLCAEMRSEAAFDRYVAICRMSELKQEALLGDLMTGSMSGWLQNTCAGRYNVLIELARSNDFSEDTRYSAILALTQLALNDDWPRDEAEAFCLQMLGEDLESSCSYLWTQTADMAIDLRTEKAIPLLKFAFESAWFDWFDYDYEELDDVMNSSEPPRKQTPGSTEESMGPILKNMSSYHCDHDTEKSDEDLLKAPRKLWNKPDIIPKPVSKKEPGRNTPCPCGSGKKYKKCCINKDVVETGAREPRFKPLSEADSWMGAGYFHHNTASSRDVTACWKKAWQAILNDSRITDEMIHDEEDNDLLASNTLSSWLHDYINDFDEYHIQDCSRLQEAESLISEVVVKFPSMSHDLRCEFDAFNVKLLLWQDKQEQAFASLKELQSTEDAAYWHRFEANLFAEDQSGYTLKNDPKRELAALTANLACTKDENDKLFLQHRIDALRIECQINTQAVRKRAALYQAVRQHQPELFPQ